MKRVTSVAAAAVLAGTAVLCSESSASAQLLRANAPATSYEMPFPCGQAWVGSTRDAHSPSRNAIDWNRPDDAGDPVVASAPGVVVRAEPKSSTGYGHWVMLEHDAGERTVYAHLEDVLVVAGQSVDQGALLGTVGRTGNASGEHLHFEERLGSDVVAPYLSGAPFAFGSTMTSANCPDVPLAGNFLGGPAAELAVYRRAATSTFRIERPGREPRVLRFGKATDQPIAGDWDGNGRINPGVRAPGRTLFRLRAGGEVTKIRFGAAQDQPIAGDWNGDGRWEIGVRQPGGRFVLRAADGSTSSVGLGDGGDLPVTGDWDGDGSTDLGVYDQAAATFTLRIVDDTGLTWLAQVQFGEPGDLPVTGDWDGNGTTEVGVWHPTTATFSERRAASATASPSTTATSVFGTPRPGR